MRVQASTLKIYSRKAQEHSLLWLNEVCALGLLGFEDLLAYSNKRTNLATMHLQLVSCLILLMTATSLLHATETEYVFTEDGKCRFHRNTQDEMRQLHIEISGGDNWREVQSFYITDPNPTWKQLRADGKKYTYIEYCFSDEPYNLQCHRYLFMLETDDGKFRIYRSGVHFLQFDVFNHELWLFQEYSKVEIKNQNVLHAFDLGFEGSGDLILNQCSFIKTLASQKLLSAMEIEGLRKRELLARVGRTWPTISLLHRFTQGHEASVHDLNADILVKQISPLLVLLDSGPSQERR